jgi:hypothetical protein
MQKTLLPLPADLPTFEVAIESLERVPEVLYQALEHAAAKTKEFKDSHFPKRKRLDACLTAVVFRAHVIEYMNGEGIEAREDSGKWSFRHLPFCGISFYYKKLHVRILKGPDGILPGCGYSKRRKMFYDQNQTRYLVDNQIMESDANLIVLWDLDSSFALAHIWLALPCKGGKRPQDVSVYWCDEIPHPIQKVVPVPETTTVDDGLDNLLKPRKDIEDDEQSGTE